MGAHAQRQVAIVTAITCSALLLALTVVSTFGTAAVLPHMWAGPSIFGLMAFAALVRGERVPGAYTSPVPPPWEPAPPRRAPLILQSSDFKAEETGLICAPPLVPPAATPPRNTTLTYAPPFAASGEGPYIPADPAPLYRSVPEFAYPVPRQSTPVAVRSASVIVAVGAALGVLWITGALAAVIGVATKLVMALAAVGSVALLGYAVQHLVRHLQHERAKQLHRTRVAEMCAADMRARRGG